MIKKLLIVDNLKSLVDTEKSILSRASIEIFTATSGEEALEIHRKEKADLIITALELPGMGGDKLCSIIRAEEGLKRVSVIVVCTSSKADTDRVERCKANAYVTKPVKPIQLLDKVAQLLNIPERKTYRVLLRVTVNGKSSNGSFFCSSKDISSTGILVQTNRKFEVGDVISCTFFLPNSLRVSTDAEIVRVAKNGADTFLCGARYVNLAEDCRSAIDSFISKRAGTQ